MSVRDRVYKKVCARANKIVGPILARWPWLNRTIGFTTVKGAL